MANYKDVKYNVDYGEATGGAGGGMRAGARVAPHCGPLRRHQPPRPHGRHEDGTARHARRAAGQAAPPRRLHARSPRPQRRRLREPRLPAAYEAADRAVVLAHLREPAGPRAARRLAERARHRARLLFPQAREGEADLLWLGTMAHTPLAPPCAPHAPSPTLAHPKHTSHTPSPSLTTPSPQLRPSP